MTDWNKRFVDLAIQISSWSKDKSRKVGCVIVDDKRTVLSTGYNGFPRGIDDDVDQRHERPTKYLYVSHAEANAIYNAARNGIKLDGSTLYVCSLFVCSECAKAIIQSGIKKVVAPKPNIEDERWFKSFELSIEMLNEADVEIQYY